MTLKEYIDKYSPFGFSDDELIVGFLKKRPDVLAETISTLCMMNYKSVLSLEHKVKVKDEYLNCVKDWAQPKTNGGQTMNILAILLSILSFLGLTWLLGGGLK